MMPMYKRTVVALLAIMLSLCASLASASEIESSIEQSMRDAIVKAGVQGKAADGIARRYMFIGTVMLSSPRYAPAETASALLAQSEKTGAALGKALGNAYMTYGDKKLHYTATLMMRSVRAGLIAETAAETFSVLAANGYAFDATVAIIQQTSEFVRSSSLSDRGVALCAQIRKLAAGQEKAQTLQKAIVLAASREKEKQRILMAQKEAEMRAKDGRDGSDRVASRTNGSQQANPARGSSSPGSISSSRTRSQGSDSNTSNGTGSAGSGSSTGSGNGESAAKGGSASDSGSGNGGSDAKGGAASNSGSGNSGSDAKGDSANDASGANAGE